MNIESVKKKIVWVTPDDFMDTDLNPGLFRLLLEQYEIKWVIIFPKIGARFSETDFSQFKEMKGLEIVFIFSIFRQRNPRRILFYISLYKTIFRGGFDLLYFNLGPSDPYVIPLFWRLPKVRTIFSVHEGNINDNFKMPLISKALLNLSYGGARYVHMFSSLSAALFQARFPQSQIFTTPMPLKSFGQSQLRRPMEPVVFLVFGIISYAKNIDLLIDAVCNLYKKGHRNFRVSINGSCANWEFYQEKIKYPEIFDCDIRLIDNKEIPDLFCTSHYLVQPYRSTSQSGVIKIAMNYNLPIIASDLPGLKAEIEEGVNGFLFRAGDAYDLEQVLLRVLIEHRDSYTALLEKMRTYTRKNYSDPQMNNQFLTMIDEVISQKI